jgi:cytoskeletal protein CcmA (bactofilin family)
MWKKETVPSETPVTDEHGRHAQQPSTPKPAVAPAPVPASLNRATIGRSITIRGDVTGDEDLLIQGRVEGSVDLQQHSVTVGAEGEVNASILGRVVTIEGRVEGNIRAEEQAILRSSASVHGDINAPRVVLEDGARFRGGIDMGDAEERASRSAAATASRTKRTPEPGQPQQETPGTRDAATHSSSGSTSATAKGNGPKTEGAAEIRV